MQPRDMPAGFVTTLVCVTSLLIIGLRACGLRVMKTSSAKGPERRAQFSLLGLILVTTIIGVAIGVLEAMRPMLGSVRYDGGVITGSPPISLAPVAIQLRGVIIAAMIALAGTGGLWVVLRPGAIWVRLAAMIALIPAAALYLTYHSDAPNTYVGLSTTTHVVRTTTNIAGALAAVAVLCGLCGLPLRWMVFVFLRPLPLAIQAAERAPQPLGLTKRVAAILLLSTAIFLVRVGDRFIERNTPAYAGRININSYELSPLLAWSPLGPTDEIQTPMSALAQWIDPKMRWNDVFLLKRGTHVHFFSQLDWLEYSLNVQSSNSTTSEASPGEEKSNEQTQVEP